jgi:hypothetical protein
MARIQDDEAQRLEIVEQLGQTPAVEELAGAIVALEKERSLAPALVERAMAHEVEDMKRRRQKSFAEIVHASTLQESDLDGLLLACPGRFEIPALSGHIER